MMEAIDKLSPDRHSVADSSDFCLPKKAVLPDDVSGKGRSYDPFLGILDGTHGEKVELLSCTTQELLLNWFSFRILSAGRSSNVPI